LPADLIFSEDYDVTDDNVDGVAQACIAIQLGDLHASNNAIVDIRLCPGMQLTLSTSGLYR